MPRPQMRRWFPNGGGRKAAPSGPVVVERVTRPEEPVVHETWMCKNQVCGAWTRPSQSHDGASCHNCGRARPAHLTERAEAAAHIRRAA
jgi:hypothetical protein